jgi:signal transduction histidine kinase
MMIDRLLDNTYAYGAGRPIRVSVTPGEDCVVASFEDRGPGIPVEDLERVRRPFVRLAHDAERDVQRGGVDPFSPRRCWSGMGGAFGSIRETKAG